MEELENELTDQEPLVGIHVSETEYFTKSFSMRVMYQAGLCISAERKLKPDDDELEKINQVCVEVYDPMAADIVSESLAMLVDQISRCVSRSPRLAKKRPTPTENDVELFSAYWIERAEFYGAFIASEVLTKLSQEEK